MNFNGNLEKKNSDISRKTLQKCPEMVFKKKCRESFKGKMHKKFDKCKCFAEICVLKLGCGVFEIATKSLTACDCLM